MAEFYVDLAISIEAENKDEAYEKIKNLVTDINDWAVDITNAEE